MIDLVSQLRQFFAQLGSIALVMVILLVALFAMRIAAWLYVRTSVARKEREEREAMRIHIARRYDSDGR